MLLRVSLVLLVACVLHACGGARVRGRHRTRGWSAATTDHVVLYTDVDPQVALETAWALEDFDRALAHVFLDCTSLSTRAPTEVVMLADARDYVDVAPPQTGGFFTRGRSGVGAIPARIVVPASADGRHVNVAQVFVHELTHRFVHACFPDAPVWLNEGIATYFETLRVRDDAVLVGIAPYRFEPGETAELVRADGVIVHRIDPVRLPPVSELVRLRPEEFYARELDHEIGRAHYAAAWALVHLLLVGGDADLRARFVRFLEVLRTSRVDASGAFAQAFRGRDLDGEVSVYLTAWERRRRRIAYTPSLFAHPMFHTLAGTEVDLVWAQLFIPQPGHEQRARSYLSRARAEPFTRVPALLLLAGMESDGMQRRRLVEAARVEDPSDREVLRARAWLEVERGVRDAASDAVFAEISSVPDPSTTDLVLRARLAVQGREPGVAVEAARAAVERDPTLWSARYALGLAYAAESWWDAARVELDAVRIATMEHEPAVAREVLVVLARLADLAAQTPPPHQPEETVSAEEFGPQVVVRAINTRRSAIQACYERALTQTPLLTGRVTVQLSIQPAGETTGVHVISSPEGLGEVGACICRVVDALSFDPGPTGGAVTYTFPFVFEPAS